MKIESTINLDVEEPNLKHLSLRESEASHPIGGDNFLLLKNPTSDKLAILFSGTFKNSGRFDFWNVGKALNDHVNVLLLNNGRNQWYQQGIPDFGKSLEDSVTHIGKFVKQLNIKHIYTIGVSMGGYGAVLFGRLLNAKVLAFGIDSEVCIPGSRSRKSMHASAAMEYPDLRPLLLSKKIDLTLIVGEMDILDLYGAVRISNIPGVKTISVRGMDHGGGRYIEKTKGLASFIKSFIDGEVLPPLNEEGDILDHPDLIKSLYKAHCLGLESNWEKSFEILKPLVTAYPESDIAHYSFALTLIKLKKYNEARMHLCFVAAMVPHFISGRFYLAYCLRMEKRYKASLHLFLEQLKEKPQSAPTLFNVGLIYLSLGEQYKARSYIEKAVEIQPNKKIYSDKLRSLKS
ncbi:hypothetical protein NJF54_01795 [Pseudomonas guariconensis]|uniref:CDC27 family protein n=1 Tax=Pseudomonas guariconensis TaxID=1288410 RepID=UPI00209B5AEE|nr:CDC27 family protein [Pseudomonas guariconensis]MCO7630556.1 hypothetical protein [Pseudomonas guariconensis]